MSATEYQPSESKSSIKTTLNAKHDPQFEIKIVEGTTTEEMDRLRGIAVAQFKALLAELGVAR